MKTNQSHRILFIAGKDEVCFEAAEFLQKNFSKVDTIFWVKGEQKPGLPDNWTGEWIFSFKSDFILPGKLIRSASKGAVNFHPAPPYYRGTGGYVYAIYNHDKTFAVTCHYMSEQLDSGEIIKVDKFDIITGETVSSLRQKAGIKAFAQFREIISLILSNQKLPQSPEKWGDKLYTQKEFEKFLRDKDDSLLS